MKNLGFYSTDSNVALERVRKASMEGLYDKKVIEYAYENNKPLFSVITPLHDAYSFLLESLNVLLSTIKSITESSSKDKFF